ncbi:MAG: FecR family protein [Dysgonamonadaceae bacterium]|jgi:ferric-dicitrate binding protein FerR (iron transport regulator)|nr:FecR family protein [Dysgonamonadaceae bacterium]
MGEKTPLDADQLLKQLLSGRRDNSPEDLKALILQLKRKENAEVRRALKTLRGQTLSADNNRLWERLQKQISRWERKQRALRYLRYAATCLLPLSVLLSLLPWLWQKPAAPVAETVIPKAINIEHKAFLQTAKGDTVLLLSDSRDTIRNNRGAPIGIDTAGTLLVIAEDIREKEPEYQTIVVPRGGEYKLEFDDGTRIVLNSESELRFPEHFSGNSRNVFLRGEGYFEVAPDSLRPFRVFVDHVIVEVLGTDFNINAYRENHTIAATLIKGSVRVSLPGKECLLRPNQQALCSADNIDVRSVNTDDYASWTRGRFYFEKIPLSDLMLQLERWYDLQVIWEDDILKTYLFTGAMFRRNSAQEILAMLDETTNIQFDVEDRKVTVRRKNELK